jgi:DNA polymerase V
MNYIGLIDCNNFFVSCERVFRPDLRGKPVAVLSGNDGCIVARSQEIKDNNIPMGVPYFQVKDILSDIKATLFSSHFTLYRDFSRRVFAVVAAELGTIEQYSIDECFFAISGEEEAVRERLLRLKQLVEKSTGIPVSIGVGFSKTQAKYASKRAKKTDGVYLLSGVTWTALLPAVTLAELWGVGSARARAFSAKGLVTVAEYVRVPRSQIATWFGLEGVRLWAELRGEAALPIKRVVPAQKSYMSSGSFPAETNDFQVLKEAVLHHTQSVARDLYQNQQGSTTLRVMIYPSRYSDFAFQGASREAVLVTPTSDIFTLQKQALELLKAGFKPGVPYKRAGVVVGQICDLAYQADSLFPDSKTSREVSDILFSLQRRFGQEQVQLGVVKAKTPHLWQSKRKALSPSYTTQWQALKIVR